MYRRRAYPRVCHRPVRDVGWRLAPPLHLMLDTARHGMLVVTLFAAEGGRAMLVELSIME
jgi:hypothetical protein